MNKASTLCKVLTIGFLLAQTSTSQAWQIDTQSFDGWLAQRTPKASVYTEMNKYFIKEGLAQGSEYQGYISGFLQSTHNKLTRRTLQILELIEKDQICKSYANVDFPQNLTNRPEGQSFESEILNIETMNCFQGVDADRVFRALHARDLQMKVVPGIKDITIDEKTNLICQNTSNLGVGTSSFCFTQNIWRTEGLYVIQSFNEANRGNPSAPIYFRDGYTIIKTLKSGAVVFFNGGYVRTKDLPLHGFVKSKIAGNQKDMAKEILKKARSL